MMAVGGPCIAGELAAKRDTSVVVTGPQAAVRTALDGLAAPFYHARYSPDVIGVEICAASRTSTPSPWAPSLGDKRSRARRPTAR